MSNDIKRMRYFNGLILKEDEFKQDQEYHISMRRRHNLHLHGSGIVHGLEPGLTTQDHLIEVSEGMAMDPLGREVILSATTQVDLSGYVGGDLVYVWVAYNEQDTDVIPDRGGDDFVHIKESAAVLHGKSKPSSDDYVLIGFVEFFTNAAGDPVLYEHSFRELDTLGRPVRVIAGENKESVITRTLTLSDSQINEADRPFIDGRLFEDGSTGKAGIDVVSEHSRFSGDLEISGSLAFSGGPSVSEITEDLDASSGDGSASLATVAGIRDHVAGIAGPLDSRLAGIEASRSVVPVADSIVIRGASGSIQAVDATVADDVVTLRQLQQRGLIGNLDSANPLTVSLDDALETGAYFCSAELPGLPVPPNGEPQKGILLVWKEGNGNTRQQFMSTAGSSVYTRLMAAGIWSAWDTMLTRSQADGIYMKVSGSSGLQGNFDAGFYRIVNLASPVDNSDAARLTDVAGAKSYADDILALHTTSTQHDDYYLSMRTFIGDLDRLAVTGAALVFKQDELSHFPGGVSEGIIYTNGITGLAENGTDRTVFRNQIFVSFKDERMWLRTGSASYPIPAEGDPEPTYTMVWNPWQRMITDSILVAHAESEDHDLHYLNLSGSTPLQGDLNADSHRLTNVAPGVDAADVVIKSQLDSVQQGASTAVTLLSSSLNTALEAHKESTDHDGSYAALRSYTGDLNALATEGVIGIQTGSTNLPPGTLHGIVVNSRLSDGTELLSQLFVDPDQNGMWLRTKPGVASWSDWTSLTDHPTLTRDFSNPTTGCWMRHPDGTIEQFGVVQTTLGSLAEYPVSISFPQAFTQVAQVMVTPLNASYSYSSASFNDRLEIAQGIEHTTGFPATLEIQLQWRAIGI